VFDSHRAQSFFNILFYTLLAVRGPAAREPWRQRRRGSPNFLPCGAMLTQHLDHKLGEHKAILGWPFLSQLLVYKQMKQTTSFNRK